ncbi:MAG: hypothetical protein H8E32_12495 [Nitrospinae bacterium]|nr:hypothetical protein [Nitrospinota bacterium]
MFDISENGKEVMASYFEKAFGDKQNKKPELPKDKNQPTVQSKNSRLQNLILTKSLIVKF